MASSSSHSAPSTSSRLCKYDVFLSFRGEDTRKTFVDHLYSALVQRAIHTYKDDETLPRGESIGPFLLTAIDESRIAVIVFSKNYADSSWCLEELSYIMKCKNEGGIIVMPIFYDVEPSQVRQQKGDFGAGFAKQEVKNITKVEQWRKALVDASELAGWEPKNIANGHESKAIKEIVNKIFGRLFHLYSDVDEDLVGMKARLDDLKLQLDFESCDVRMVGIWGVGGSGKTTLASSIYMEMSCHFEGHCIVDNIREESSRLGLKTLQERILSRVLNTQVGVQSVEQGKYIMKSRLCNSSVLLLLDDVDKLEQLEALAGSKNWFGIGSRIIITTRDRHLLKTHKVDVYPITLLSNDEASRLFDKHAYNKVKPIKEYEELSSRVVFYADGLPLALKVLGSFLYDKDEKGWMSALDRLEATPKMEIVEKLKLSYDGLETQEKELFLDIACFFRWERVDDVMEILDACGFYPEIGIHVLRQKALITINEDGQFDMHDLVQEMGHYIVRGEHPNSCETHSRVWKHEEINNICYGDAIMENDKIEAIRYGYTNSSSHICNIVSNMKRLRWLKVYMKYEKNDGGPNFLTSCFCGCLGFIMKDDRHDGGPSFLSNELRYIDWRGYPGSSFPNSFQPMKLVVLKLAGSLQKELWKGKKQLPRLKVLELVGMNIIRTPDFDGLSCLQKLILDSCEKLEEIHPSLGNHTSLEFVQVWSCEKLRMFPRIVHMEKLKTLEIYNCDEIRECPHIQAKMKNLVHLSLCYNNKIEVVPSSIGEQCTNLVSLYLAGCRELKSIEFDLKALKHLEEFCYSGYINQLQKRPPQLFQTEFHQFPHSLQKLGLYCWRLGNGEIPFEIGELSNLEELDLRESDFTRLNFSLLQLTRLKLLNLCRCERLVELPELPSSVATLLADHCSSLITVGDFNRNCKWLCGVSLLGGGTINDGGRLLESMLEGKAIENGTMVLRLEGVEMAKGFIPCLVKGNRCRLQLGENWSNGFCGFLICAVFTSNFKWYSYVMISMMEAMSGMDSQDDVDIDVVLEEGGDDDDDADDDDDEEDDDDYDNDDDDVVWEESDGDSVTWVGYVSFASLEHTPWWDQNYNHFSFHVDHSPYNDIECRGVGVRLVERKSGSQPPTETSSSPPPPNFSHYTPEFEIENDSPNALTMSLRQKYYYVYPSFARSMS